jgi:hypothetical protein
MHVVNCNSGSFDGVAMFILEDPFSGGWYMLVIMHTLVLYFCTTQAGLA